MARYHDTKTTRVIRSHYIDYIRPAFADDELLVATRVAGMDAQASPRKYRFVRARDGKTVVAAQTVWVFCDATTGRAADIPTPVLEAFPVVANEAEIQAAIDAGCA